MNLPVSIIWRGAAGFLAIALTAYGILLLGEAIADQAFVFLFAAAAGIVALPLWWFAFRGLKRVQRYISGFVAILLTAYDCALLWFGLSRRSPGALLLTFVIAIIALPCWRFAFRRNHILTQDESLN